MTKGFEPRQSGAFTRTQWNIVLLAAQNTSEGAAALEALCRTYWRPVYSFIRRKGYAPSDAQDATQGFFLRLIQKGSIASADPAKGRFRSFLLGALQHFLADERNKACAAKRGGGLAWISLDEQTEAGYSEAASTNLRAEQVFARAWAWTLINSALDSMAAEYAREGKSGLFESLKPFLTEELHTESYGALSIELGMSPNTLAKNVQRLRERFRLRVRSAAAQTVANPADLEDELRQLFAA